MKNTVIATLPFNCFLKVEKWAHIMLSIFCDTTSLSTSNHWFLIIGSNCMASYDNVIINAVSHDMVPKILGFHLWFQSCLFLHSTQTQQCCKSRWGIKILWLVIKQVFICTVFLFQRTVGSICSGDAHWWTFPQWFAVVSYSGLTGEWSLAEGPSSLSVV